MIWLNIVGRIFQRKNKYASTNKFLSMFFSVHKWSVSLPDVMDHSLKTLQNLSVGYESSLKFLLKYGEAKFYS